MISIVVQLSITMITMQSRMREQMMTVVFAHNMKHQHQHDSGLNNLVVSPAVGVRSH